MKILQPQPREQIVLFGETFEFREHPSAPWMAYCAEGRRASVYQVQNGRAQLWALKVFKPMFRDPSLDDQGSLGDRTRGIEGLRSSHRRVVPPNAPAARMFRELKYAILMPWIDGQTWADILLGASAKAVTPQLEDLIPTCYQLTRVLAQMEAVGVAHTDLSPGNLIVDLRAREVQLIDLEDMYFPKKPSPRFENAGVPGYRPVSVEKGESLWRHSADRYAGAMLAAEFLLLSQPGFSKRFTSESLFTGPCGTAENEVRFAEAMLALAGTFPRFATLFSRAWKATRLEECPRLRELCDAVASDFPSVQAASPRASRGAAPASAHQPTNRFRSSSWRVPLVAGLVILLAVLYFALLRK